MAAGMAAMGGHGRPGPALPTMVGRPAMDCRRWPAARLSPPRPAMPWPAMAGHGRGWLHGNGRPGPGMAGHGWAWPVLAGHGEPASHGLPDVGRLPGPGLTRPDKAGHDRSWPAMACNGRPWPPAMACHGLPWLGMACHGRPWPAKMLQEAPISYFKKALGAPWMPIGVPLEVP